MTRFHPLDPLRTVVQEQVEREGLRPLSARTGVSVGQLRGLLAGRDSRCTTIDALCHALDVQLHFGGPPRTGASTQEAEMAGPPSMAPVSDRRLAEVLTRLVDGWERSDSAERDRLAGAVNSVLDLAGPIRTLELRRLIAWLGFRLIDGGSSAKTGG